MNCNRDYIMWDCGDGTVNTPWIAETPEHLNAIRLTIAEQLIDQGIGSWNVPPIVHLVNVTRMK